MNRLERRKAGNDKVPVVDLDKVRHRVLKNAAVDYATVVAFELYNKVKMEPDKIKTVIEDLNGLFDDVIRDYVSIEDMRQALEDEAGLIVK